MGVKHLWSFLSPVKRHVILESLQGQVIAVDLSIWIVEAQNHLPGSITKPHLRHLFFRVTHLLQLGIIPVVVIEGIPPDLKQQVMKDRIGQSDKIGHMKRTRFNALHKECCEMLKFMGLPYVQAAGEAEAMCAFLNSQGLVDGCITNDGDAFLYGATKVYRNFTINQKSYCMKEIEIDLGLCRETLVGLAILCGCDYFPKGIGGCGKGMIKKFLKNLKGDSLLQRFKSWMNTNSMSSGSMDNIEQLICKKALNTPGFPFPEEFAYNKMEWPEVYSVSKILPLLTLHDMKLIIEQGQTLSCSMIPHRIVKSRIKQGEHCYEVQWNKIDGEVFTQTEYYTTLEDQEIFKRAFPDLVQEFETKKTQLVKPKKKNSKIQMPILFKEQSTKQGKIDIDQLTANMQGLILDNNNINNKFNMLNIENLINKQNFDVQENSKLKSNMKEMQNYSPHHCDNLLKSINRRRSKSLTTFVNKRGLNVCGRNQMLVARSIEDLLSDSDISWAQHGTSPLQGVLCHQKLADASNTLENKNICSNSDQFKLNNNGLNKHFKPSPNLMERLKAKKLNNNCKDEPKAKVRMKGSHTKFNIDELLSLISDDEEVESGKLCKEFMTNMSISSDSSSEEDGYNNEDHIDDATRNNFCPSTDDAIWSNDCDFEVGNFNIETSLINFSCTSNNLSLAYTSFVQEQLSNTFYIQNQSNLANNHLIDPIYLKKNQFSPNLCADNNVPRMGKKSNIDPEIKVSTILKNVNRASDLKLNDSFRDGAIKMSSTPVYKKKENFIDISALPLLERLKLRMNKGNKFIGNS